MGRFEGVLRRLSEQLAVPLPEKPKIIAEISDDLDALYDHYRSAGLDEPAAEEAAVRKVIADGTVIEELQALNTPVLERVAGRIPRSMRRVGELAIMFTAGSLVVLLSAALTAFVPWLKGRVFFWVLAGIMFATVISGVVVLKTLFFTSPRELLPARFRLRLMLWLGVFAALIGIDGVLYELLVLCNTFAAADGLPFIEYNPFIEYANEFIGAGITHLNIGFGIAFIAVLVWFAGTGRLARLEYHEDLVNRIIGSGGRREE